MSFMKIQDAISGQEAKAFSTINGQREEMFYAKKLKAEAEKTKASLKTLGKRGEQSKATGWKGTGEMTIYYVTSKFRELMLDYIKNGKDAYFDVTVINEDPASSIGKQTTILRNVNLDKVIMAMLDVDAEALEEDISFTYDDVDLLDKFGKPVLG